MQEMLVSWLIQAPIGVSDAMCSWQLWVLELGFTHANMYRHLCFVQNGSSQLQVWILLYLLPGNFLCLRCGNASAACYMTCFEVRQRYIILITTSICGSCVILGSLYNCKACSRLAERGLRQRVWDFIVVHRMTKVQHELSMMIS